MPEEKKSVVPRLRFPEFRDAGEWEVKQIGDFTDCTAGGTPNTLVPAYWGGEIRWMSSGELHMKFVTEVKGRITQEGLKNSSTELIPPKCVLVGLAGQGKTRGTVAINLIEICTNQSIAAIYPNSEFVPEYLYYVLDSRYNELRILSAGDGGRGGLNLTLIRSIPIPLPPLPEQQKIADCLASLDEVINLQTQKLDALTAHKKGLMQQLFPREGETTPRLRFPEFREAGEWEVKRLGEVCSTFSGGTPNSSRKEYYGGSIPFIRSAEINQDRTELFLTEEGFKNSSAKLVVKGDILIALYGANSGDGALSKIDGAINQAILCLRSKFNHIFILDYWRLREKEIVMQYIQGGQGNLSAEIVKSIAFAFPSPSEQQKIADCLSSLDEVINLQTQKLDALKANKKGLMQQLFPQEVD